MKRKHITVAIAALVGALCTYYTYAIGCKQYATNIIGDCYPTCEFWYCNVGDDEINATPAYVFCKSFDDWTTKCDQAQQMDDEGKVTKIYYPAIRKHHSKATARPAPQKDCINWKHGPCSTLYVQPMMANYICTDPPPEGY
jgi:hypothetical protein